MAKFAILLGSAPEDFRQKKIEEMYGFLDSKKNAGDSIVTFANGISELMLEMVLDNSVRQLAESVIEPVEITSQQERHSELVSESAKKMLNQVQHDKNARHCERSEAISETEGDCFVADASRNDGKNKPNSILLYICTLQPVAESEKTFWLGGEEIRRDVISHYQEIAAEYGIDMQVVMDWDREMVSEEELGWEEASESVGITTQKDCHSEFIAESVKEMLNQVQHDKTLRISAQSAGDCHCERSEAIPESAGGRNV